MYNEFEELTRNVAHEVKKVSTNLQNGMILCGSKNKIEGASGYKHQIDVSIEVPNEKLILIECKRYNSKVALKDMLVLVARVDDINKGKKIDVTGNFFTTKGFTKPAEKIGKYYNIDLNTFKDLEHFAVHIGGNVLIRPRTLVFDTNK